MYIHIWGFSDVECFIGVGRSLFSYPVNLKCIQGFAVSVEGLVIGVESVCVWCVLEP